MKQLAKALGWGLVTVLLLLAAAGSSRLATQRIAALRRYRPPLSASVVHASATFANSGLKRGPDTATVKIVLFTDYRCPSCRQLIPLMDSLVGLHDDIQLIERMFSQSGYVGGERLPQAVYCSQAMGRTAELRARLQRAHVDLEDDQWGSIGMRAGITDTVEFKRCLEGDRFDSLVLADRSAGTSLKIVYPPAMLIDDSLYLSVPLSLQKLDTAIRALKRHRP